MTQAYKKKVWFITGCSTGFGRLLTETLIERGDKVVATARKTESLKELAAKYTPQQILVLPLDVTKRDQVEKSVHDALIHFDRIDVLVNNAGFGSVGALEEVSEKEIREVFETNVFGLFALTRAILPIFRAQKSGHILNLSSVSGMVGRPGASIYAATKFAVEGHSEGLAAEVAPFGIKVTLIEPGAFRTDFASRSLHVAPKMSEYNLSLKETRQYYDTIGGNQPGDPAKAVEAMIAVVNHDSPPLRLVLGAVALDAIEKKLNQYARERADWRDTTLGADFK